MQCGRVTLKKSWLGTIHKTRGHFFFWIFDTPLLHVVNVCSSPSTNFDQILIPTPLNCQRLLWTAPYSQHVNYIY